MAKKMFTVGKTMYCPVCEENRQFYSGGKQTFPNVVLKLWNCFNCGATVTTRDHTGNTAVLREVAQK